MAIDGKIIVPGGPEIGEIVRESDSSDSDTIFY